MIMNDCLFLQNKRQHSKEILSTPPSLLRLQTKLSCCCQSLKHMPSAVQERWHQPGLHHTTPPHTKFTHHLCNTWFKMHAEHVTLIYNYKDKCNIISLLPDPYLQRCSGLGTWGVWSAPSSRLGTEAISHFFKIRL